MQKWVGRQSGRPLMQLGWRGRRGKKCPHHYTRLQQRLLAQYHLHHQRKGWWWCFQVAGFFPAVGDSSLSHISSLRPQLTLRLRRQGRFSLFWRRLIPSSVSQSLIFIHFSAISRSMFVRTQYYLTQKCRLLRRGSAKRRAHDLAASPILPFTWKRREDKK